MLHGTCHGSCTKYALSISMFCIRATGSSRSVITRKRVNPKCSLIKQFCFMRWSPGSGHLLPSLGRGQRSDAIVYLNTFFELFWEVLQRKTILRVNFKVHCKVIPLKTEIAKLKRDIQIKYCVWALWSIRRREQVPRSRWLTQKITLSTNFAVQSVYRML